MSPLKFLPSSLHELVYKISKKSMKKSHTEKESKPTSHKMSYKKNWWKNPTRYFIKKRNWRTHRRPSPAAVPPSQISPLLPNRSNPQTPSGHPSWVVTCESPLKPSPTSKPHPPAAVDRLLSSPTVAPTRHLRRLSSPPTTRIFKALAVWLLRLSWYLL